MAMSDWQLMKCKTARMTYFNRGAASRPSIAGVGEHDCGLASEIRLDGSKIDVAGLHSLKTKCDWSYSPNFHFLENREIRDQIVERVNRPFLSDDARWRDEADACCWVF